MRNNLLRKVLFGGAVFIPLFAFATDWYIMDVDTTPNSGVYGTSIALDSVRIPHIAYCRYNGPGLMYASFNQEDSTWIIESVFDSAVVKSEIDGPKIAGGDPSLKFDSNGYPHISFWWGDLGYAWKDSLGWHTTHPFPGTWIMGTSLVLDKNDYPYIGYSVDTSDTTALVLHTYRDEYGWHSEVVDTIHFGWPGNVSLAIDKGNKIHIAYGQLRREEHYYGLPDIGIRYGIREGAGEWQIEEIIDSADTVTEWEGSPSLVLDSLGRPCISYEGVAVVDTSIGKLKYAVKIDSIWNIEWVDVTNGGMAGMNFLAFDTSNNPHISYEGNRCLMYAWKSSGVWHVEKIDSAWGYAIQASYTGLVMDDNGYAYISYNREYTMNWGNLRYATGLPETGIEIEPKKFRGGLLKVYPSLVISQREVSIEYSMEKTSNVNISIYNILGQKVTELVNEEKPCGKHVLNWDSKDTKAGIYFCYLKVENSVFVTQKIVLIK